MLVPPPPRAAPAPEAPPRAPSNMTEWSVADLAGALKRTLEDAFGHVRLRGEISGYRGPHGSGHAYFSLKDGSARIDAVVWKGVLGRLRQRPQEGLEVIATGRITTFAGKSSYQIVIDALEPAGIGAWMALLEERRRVLAAEGLFAPERKRPIPYLPRVVGIVTSPTGAVIRDILHRLADRFPRPVLVWPVRVQGEGAAEEVAAALAGFNALPEDGPVPRPDVLIVARGGGSIEDLWTFNEECVVRAVADSRIPVISAVGHETDTTLIDHAADRRAPTPTAAAEMAVPVRADLVATVDDLAGRGREAARRGLERQRADLRAAARALPGADAILGPRRQRLDLADARLAPALAGNARAFRLRLTRVLDGLTRHPPGLALARARTRLSAIDHRPRTALTNLVARRSLAVDALHHRLVQARATGLDRARTDLARGAERLAALHGRVDRAWAALIERRRLRLDAAGGLLGSLSYRAVLARGYALVRDASGATLSRAAALAPGALVTLEFADGARRARVGGGDAPETARIPARPAGERPEARAPAPAGRQGSLF